MSCTNCGSASPAAKPCQSCPGSMAGKPVYYVDSKTTLRFESEFGQKRLCDGFTFTLGSICVYGCTYCYVISVLLKLSAIQAVKASAALLGCRLEEVVIRRRKALKLLRRQLTLDKPAAVNLRAKAVVYTSPLVDPAANMVLVKETAAACRIIFELTNWDVRVLSKSHLLPQLAKLIPEEFKQRMIYGCSTGILDDKLAAVIEKGAPPVRKRLESIHRLQDEGHRTFYMFCPVLPQADSEAYAESLAAAARLDKAEHAWVEPINLRGDSFTATITALDCAGYHEEARRLARVCGEGSEPAWEQYARDTFEAVARVIPADKLRFLQYVKPKHAAWWIERERQGAVLLGKMLK